MIQKTASGRPDSEKTQEEREKSSGNNGMKYVVYFCKQAYDVFLGRIALELIHMLMNQLCQRFAGILGGGV
jgi:hypothetical protein